MEVGANPLDLATIIQEITDRLPIVDAKMPIEIDTDLMHTGELVLPQTRVMQILENLISNAHRYLDSTKTHHYLKIASIDRGDCVQITLQDNGLGIDEQFSERMFTMFQRFHTNTAPGSGLGLYIVKKHVDKLGARISYRRTSDGSLFTLILNRSITNS